MDRRQAIFAALSVTATSLLSFKDNKLEKLFKRQIELAEESGLENPLLFYFQVRKDIKNYPLFSLNSTLKSEIKNLNLVEADCKESCMIESNKEKGLFPVFKG